MARPAKEVSAICDANKAQRSNSDETGSIKPGKVAARAESGVGRLRGGGNHQASLTDIHLHRRGATVKPASSSQ